MTSPCPSGASGSRAWGATSRCTPSTSSPSSRPPGSSWRDHAALRCNRSGARMTNLRFVATVPRGFSDLLAGEVSALGAQNVRDQAGGVQFEGPLATGYKVLLESRLASRVLLEVASGPMASAEDFYQ